MDHLQNYARAPCRPTTYLGWDAYGNGAMRNAASGMHRNRAGRLHPASQCVCTRHYHEDKLQVYKRQVPVVAVHDVIPCSEVTCGKNSAHLSSNVEDVVVDVEVGG